MQKTKPAFVRSQLINDLIFSFIYNKGQLEMGKREAGQASFDKRETQLLK